MYPRSFLSASFSMLSALMLSNSGRKGYYWHFSSIPNYCWGCFFSV